MRYTAINLAVCLCWAFHGSFSCLWRISSLRGFVENGKFCVWMGKANCCQGSAALPLFPVLRHRDAIKFGHSRRFYFIVSIVLFICSHWPVQWMLYTKTHHSFVWGFFRSLQCWFLYFICNSLRCLNTFIFNCNCVGWITTTHSWLGTACPSVYFFFT